jgi:heme/copper-type cytochrome/quinol oxidase subunit 1
VIQWWDEMLTARLFAGLGGLLAVLSLIAAGRQLPSVDLYFHATYFVFSAKQLEIFVVLTCGIFAGIYLALGKWVPTHINRAVGLLHFILFVLAVVLGVLGVHGYSASTKDDVPSLTHIAYFFPTAALCFLAGCGLCVMNCLWALFDMIRARLSYR